MSDASKVQNAYGAEQIQVLEGLEPVRKRPGMYIGSTGPRGLHHLVYEVDNAVDEALAGHCDRIDAVLGEDGSAQVTDNGRGIPTDVHPRTGKSALETVLTSCFMQAASSAPVVTRSPAVCTVSAFPSSTPSVNGSRSPRAARARCTASALKGGAAIGSLASEDQPASEQGLDWHHGLLQAGH